MDAQAGDSRLLGWRAGQDEFFRTLVGSALLPSLGGIVAHEGGRPVKPRRPVADLAPSIPVKLEVRSALVGVHDRRRDRRGPAQRLPVMKLIEEILRHARYARKVGCWASW